MPRYTVLLYHEPEEDVYSVIVPALPGCVTFGATVDEALTYAQDAIESHVAALHESGEDVPEEDTPPIVASVEAREVTAPATV